MVYDHPGNYAKRTTVKKLAKLRIESVENGQKVLRASSNCRGLPQVESSKLTKHDRSDLNQRVCGSQRASHCRSAQTIATPSKRCRPLWCSVHCAEPVDSLP